SVLLRSCCLSDDRHGEGKVSWRCVGLTVRVLTPRSTGAPICSLPHHLLECSTMTSMESHVRGDPALLEVNRRFYDPLWTDACLVEPHRFNTWPLVCSLVS